ncbi:hypothetical protein Tco_0975009 [Tanacetum coccineum]|uniref:Retrovirus-related Pol polyprotein from transposon TNT 1-94-like beta-barrel domain-containing protein n=1 Tax=Tanacetum coccineum TaxID=301880 RepID=A0ABQ5EEC8_9ASTR
MDTGATSNLNSNAHNLSILFKTRLYSSIHVGDGNSIPVTNTGHSIIHSLHRPLHLNNVLVTPNIIKNLIFVRQFTRDNNCTIEFDAFGFSVKDFLTRHILLRCDNLGNLYPVTKPLTLPTTFMSTSSTTWHQRLGHPGDEDLEECMDDGDLRIAKEAKLFDALEHKSVVIEVDNQKIAIFTKTPLRAFGEPFMRYSLPCKVDGQGGFGMRDPLCLELRPCDCGNYV